MQNSEQKPTHPPTQATPEDERLDRRAIKPNPSQEAIANRTKPPTGSSLAEIILFILSFHL
ncbi:MAG: hypothetical protein NTW03_08815 [Verrucomicrobia bacterium]|nr:hypothetical protein [Verrucomicrobiota bacterium]